MTTYLIWLDEDGKEEKRKPNKGRPPKGFEKREDGNWYNQPVQAAPEPPEEPEEPSEDPEPPKPRLKAKKVKAYERVNPADITKHLFALSLTVSDGVITVMGPVIEGDCGVEQLTPNAIYSKIELDTVRDEIRVYSPNYPVSPSLIVTEVFKGEKA